MKRRARAVKGAVGHSLRRVTALFTALALFLPTAAMAASSLSRPTVVTDADELPTVTVELNAVVATTAGNAADALTGELEVALRVKTGSITTGEGDEAVTKAQLFHSISAALEYSPLLTPIAFNGTPIDLTGTDGLASMTSMESLKKENRISTAGALVSANWKEETVGNETQTVPNGGYLVLTAEAHSPVELKETNGNVLVVVSFKYDLTNASFNAADGGRPPVATDVDAVEKWLAETLKTPSENEDALIKFVPASVIDANRARVARELTYQSATNMMYYSDPTYDGVTMGAAGTADANVRIPKLAKNLTFADAEDPADVSKMTVLGKNLLKISTKYDEIEAGKINFDLVNQMSYDASDAAVITYYDYDNRWLGTQVLDTRRPVASQVNAYVEKYFIHPDLAASTHANSNYTDSLDREYTYRGEYPYKTVTALPNVAAADSNYAQETWEERLAAYKDKDALKNETAADGAKFPLTNKLDYVFYKRVTAPKNQAADPENDPALYDTDSDGKIDAYTTELYSASEAETKYPYIYGWALVEDVNNIDTVWTTFGTAELGPCDPTTGTVTTMGSAACLQFLDVNSIKKGDALNVKAVYEPGTGLDSGGSRYTALSEPYYEALGGISTVDGGVYVVSYDYGRVNPSGSGVSRMRDPSLRLDYVMDSEGQPLPKIFSTSVKLDNTDTAEAKFTMSSMFMSATYMLRDERFYQSQRSKFLIADFYTGSQRTLDGNLQGVQPNFDYEKYPYSEDGNQLGSMGFVLLAQMEQFRKAALTAAEAAYEDGGNYLDSSKWDMTDINAYVTAAKLADVNLRAKKNPEKSGEQEMVPVNAETLFWARYLLTDAYAIALKNGDMYLDWHQLQYHLQHATCELDGTEIKITGGLHDNYVTNESEWGVFPWSRLDDFGTAEDIEDFDDMISAAVKVVYEGNENALAKLGSTYDQRQGYKGWPYETLDSFKTDLIDIVTQIKALHESGAATEWDEDKIKTLTPEQLQYLLDVIHTSAVAATPLTASHLSFPGLANKVYWWLTGDKIKEINSWAEAFSIAYNVSKDGYHISWLSAIDATVLDEGLPITVKGLDDSSAEKTVAFRADAAGTKYSNPAAFRAALRDTVGAIAAEASDDYGTAVKAAAIPALVLQWRLLNNEYQDEDTLLSDTSNGDLNYHWIIPAPYQTWRELLEDAWEVYIEGGSDSRLASDIKSQASRGTSGTDNFWLRMNTTGSLFSSADDFRTALQNVVESFRDNNIVTTKAGLSSITWNQFQYALINNTTFTDLSAAPDASDDSTYWWRAGGHQPISSFAELLTAAWRTYGKSDGSGEAPDDSVDQNAMDALTLPHYNKKGEEITLLTFITGIEKKDDSSITTTDYLYLRAADDATKFTDASGDTFKDAIKAAIMNIINNSNYKIQSSHAITWKEMQYMLAGHTFTANNSISGVDYWWENGGSNVDYTWANTYISAVIQELIDNSSSYMNPAQIVAILPATGNEVWSLLQLKTATGALAAPAVIAQKLLIVKNQVKTNANWKVYYNTSTGKVTFPWKSFAAWVKQNMMVKEENVSETVINWAPGSSDTITFSVPSSGTSSSSTSSLMSLSPRLTLSTKALTLSSTETDEKDAQIEALTQENDTLKAENAELQARLDAVLALLAAYRETEEGTDPTVYTLERDAGLVEPKVESKIETKAVTKTVTITETKAETETKTDSAYTVEPDTELAEPKTEAKADPAYTLEKDAALVDAVSGADPVSPSKEEAKDTGQSGDARQTTDLTVTNTIPKEEEDDTMATTAPGLMAIAWTRTLRGGGSGRLYALADPGGGGRPFVSIFGERGLCEA